MTGDNQTGSEYVIRRLYQITNSYNEGFDKQILALLQLGVDRFELEFGILSQIVGDTYTVKFCVVPNGVELKNGDTFEFRNTYCDVTVASDETVAAEHIGKDDRFRIHPAYRSFGLESYIGVPIRPDGKLFGTLNFSSPSPYPRKFHDYDIDALQLMASWLEVELIRREQQEQLIMLNHRLEQQASRDSLTGLPNRRAMFRTLYKGLNRLIRNQGKGVLAILDVDYFKRINDTWGHQKGDQVLMEIARQISLSIRDYDFVARFGGEEFLLWLPETDQQECSGVFERIAGNIRKIDLVPEPVTVSTGACSFEFTGDTKHDMEFLLDNLVSRADSALYTAKSQGRNRVVCTELQKGIVETDAISGK